MSRSSVKRSYDNFCGEESIVGASPHCSPRRILTLTHGTPTHGHTHTTHHQPLFQSHAHAHALQPLAECKEESENTHMNSSPTFAPQPAAASSTAFPAAFPALAHQPFASHGPSSSSSSSSHLPRSSPPPSYSSPAPASKRVRRVGQQDVAMASEDAQEEHANEGGAVTHQSPFARLKRPALDDLMFVPRSFKKQAIAAALSGPSSSAHATPVCAPSTNPHLQGLIPPPPSSQGQTLPNYHHQLFTYDQVASIVKNALEMREEQIRAEYDRTLQELLREQFENFSSFNRDYISRNMKAKDQEDSEFSYYS